MKGIKTAVKTDWKNLAHGNTRESELSLNGIYVTGVTPGSFIHVSYHLKSSGVANVIPVWDSGNWSMDIQGIDKDGEADMSYTINCQKSDVPDTTSKIRFYSNTGAECIISNFMANEGMSPVPYIDSDELKAVGGAIVRFLSAVILNLAYAGRKEAA